MKNLIFLLASFFLLSVHHLLGCEGGVEPTPAPTLCNPREYQSNQFDWTAESFTYNRADDGQSQPIDLPSPFFLAPAEAQENENVLLFSEFLEKDFLEEDGWRLITQNFGQSFERRNPYLILYNTYSSVLRIFFAIDEVDGSFSEAVVTVEWADGTTKTSLLGHYNNEDYLSSVEDFDTEVSARVPNYFPNNVSPATWLHADVTMNYDPCTCLTDSKIKISASLIGITQFEFEIDGDIFQVIDGNGREGPSGTHSNSNKSSFQDGLKGWNSAYKDGKAGVAALKKLIKKDEAAKKKLESSEQSDPGFLESIGGLADFMGGAGQFLSGAFKLIGLFTGASEANPTPIPKPDPLFFKADLDVTGEGVTVTPQVDIVPRNPGSEIPTGSDIRFRPNYDNVLGTFNLLKNPKLSIKRYNWDGPGDGGGFGVEMQLLEPIEYVLNPRSVPYVFDARNTFLISFDYTNELGEKASTPAIEIPHATEFIARWHWLGITGDFPQERVHPDLREDVTVKVMTVWHTGTRAIPYVARYKADIELEVINTPPDFNNTQTEFGRSRGAGYSYYGPADVSRISEVCNSSTYLDKSKKNKIISQNHDGESLNDELKAKNNSHSKPLSLNVYPNPSSDNIVIRYSLLEKGNLIIKIHDTYGKLVKEVVTFDKHYPGAYEIGVDVSQLPTGMYVIYANSNMRSVAKKLIVN